MMKWMRRMPTAQGKLKKLRTLMIPWIGLSARPKQT